MRERGATLRRLALYLVLLAIGVFHPFIPQWEPVVVPAPDFFGLRLHHVDPVTNMLLLLPFGVLLRRLGARVWSAGVCALLLSASIELAQHWLAHRVAGIEDLLLNTIGGFVGAAFADRITRWARVVERPVLRSALTVVVVAFVIWSALPPPIGGKLFLWRCNAPINVGRDPAGAFPWSGRVHRASLFTGVLTPEQTATSTALYSTARDGAPLIDPDVCQRVLDAEAFTLDLDVDIPNERDRHGGVVLLYGDDFVRMNFAVGNIDGLVIFMVRTQATPILGAFPDGEDPLTLRGLEGRHRFTISYRDAHVRAWLDGALHEDRPFRMPEHNGQRRFWLPRKPLGAWLYAFGAALAVAATAAGVMSWSWAALLAMAVAVATELIQVGTFGRGLDVAQLLPILLGVAIGVVGGKRS